MRFFLSGIAFIAILFASLGFINKEDKHAKHAHEEGIPSFCKASPDPTVIVQNDGTEITIVGKGNMNNYWTETTDGYTIVRNKKGIFEYANKVSGDLVASGIKAHDLGSRTSLELTHLTTTDKSIKPTFNPLKASVLNQVNAQLQNKTYPTSGNVKILALLIDYPDLDSSFAAEEFDSLLYGDNFRSGDGSFKSFYETASNGQLTVEVDVEGWYEADSNYIYYGVDSGYGRAADLVREVVDAAELDGVDFSEYDNDNDGDVDGILVVHAGPGAEQGSMGEYIWSHRWVLNGGTKGSVNYDGVRINDYMINPETRTAGLSSNLVGIGVFCHEFGHNLGLPDLYDTDDLNGDSEGIGEWCLMAGGGWLGGEHLPCNFSAWCRVELGWDTPTQLTIGQSGEYHLLPASLNQDEMYQVNTSLSNEYFLLENRQLKGLDSRLNGSGLAIWHINTDKTNAFGNSVNADEEVKGVDLEEADGNDDLDKGNNRGDADDLFPGLNLVGFDFDDNTTPNAKLDTGINEINSNMIISNITEGPGDTIFFSFGAPPGPACTGPDTLRTSTGTFSDGSGNAEYAHNQSCSWLIEMPSGTITLDFTKFKTEPTNDSVSVFNGSDNTAPLLGSFSGTSIPSTLTSTGSNMYLEFNTNATINDSGWTATYVNNVTPMGCGTDTLTAASGTFTDGSGGNDYDNDLNCTWLIEPPGAMSITLELDSLNTEVSKDIITVYDGKTSASPVLGSYSGTNNLNTLTSTGGSMFVVFETDAQNTDRGWGANYSSSTAGISCSGSTTFTATSGTFDDGSGTNDYSNNRFCTWLINPPSGQIELTFTAFETEATFDRVIVFDGMDNLATRIGTYSGNTIPSTIVSSSNALYLEFRTNGTVVDKGWEADYQVLTSCSGSDTLRTATGSFTDGSGANDYGNNLNCDWLIQPTGAMSITLQIDSLNTEISKDIITVYDGEDDTAPTLGSYSGTNNLNTLTSTGGSMYVVFETDNQNTDRGWGASYTSSTSGISCSGSTTLTANSGTFDDGSGPDDYSNNRFCTWLINPPSGQIELSFNEFETESPFDRLIVYDGMDNLATQIGTYSGNAIPATITSSSNALYLEFRTNGTIVDKGWEADYITIFGKTCEGSDTLTAASGTFDDGSGSSRNYSDTLNCTWLIQPPSANSITIDFNSFAVEANNDSLVFYDGTDATGTKLGSYSGSTIPASFTVNSGNVFIEFATNNTVNDAGWEISYSSFIASISADQDTVTLNAGAGSTGNFNVTSNTSWSTSDNAIWLVATPLSGNLNQTVNLQAIQGNIGPIRYAEVYLDAGSAADTVVVEQLSSGRYLVANPDTLFFTDAPTASQNIDLLTNVSWNLNSTATWLTIGTGSGTNNGSSSITAQNNTTSAIRTDFIVASGNFGVSNDTIYVVQDTAPAVIPPQLSVTPKNLILEQPMGSLDSFVVNSNVSWTATAGDPWLRLTLPTSTVDTGKVIVTANSMNPNANSRSSFVAIENAAGTLFDTVFVDQQGLAISLSGSPDTVLLASQTGSTADVTVTSNTNWTATEGDTWFSSSQVSGSSDAVLTLTTNSDNTLGTQRVSYLALDDVPNGVFDTVVVIQDTVAIGLIANPDTIRISSTTGSSATFSISTNFGWNTVTNDPWITVDPASGNGSSVVTVSANTDNPLNIERTTYVAIDALSGSINQDTVYVVQEASQISLSATPTNINLGFASGSSDLISVSSNTNWNVTNPATWLNVNPVSGSNNGSITVSTASDNLSGASRSATLTISATGAVDQLVTVTQIDGSTPTFEVSVDTVFIDNPQGSTGTFSVLSNQSNWTLTEDTPWLLINPDSGSNTALITALVASKNIFGQERYAEVVASANGFSDRTVVIAQEKSTPLFQVSPSLLELGPDSADFGTFNISSNMNSWKITENADWFKVTPDSGAFTEQITVEATESNNSGTIRSEDITVTSPPLVPLTVTVTQDTTWAIGIDEINIENSIKLYPNPTSDYVTIELIDNGTLINEINFEVVNLVGEQMPIAMTPLSNRSIQLNLESYASGIYFVRIVHQNKFYTKKISLID